LDDDERLPIHWAVSYGQLEVALLLAQRKDFDPDVQDGSGWTPLMMAVSLKEGDELVNLLLQKGADVNQISEVYKLITCKDIKLKIDELDFNGQVRSLYFRSYSMC